MPLSHLHFFFGKISIHVFGPFFNCAVYLFLKLSCMSCVYILDSDPLSVISLENVFSNSVGCLFFLMVSFSLQKLLRLIRSHFFNFGFYFLSFRRQIQKQILLWFTSKDVLPMFSSRSLIVSSLTFRSLTHFKFIFVYGVRECSNFILLYVAVQFPQHHLLKGLSFLHCILFSLLSYINWPWVCGFISGLFLLFYWSMCLFLCQYHTLLITVAM